MMCYDVITTYAVCWFRFECWISRSWSTSKARRVWRRPRWPSCSTTPTRTHHHSDSRDTTK